jgi:transglutaminase-like putative cysteine protease
MATSNRSSRRAKTGFAEEMQPIEILLPTSAATALRILGFVVCLGLVFGSNRLARGELIADLDRLELQGQFIAASNMLSSELGKKALSDGYRKTLEFEMDRLERIKKDFPYTKDALFAELKKSVKGLSRTEFDQWIDQDRFDSRDFDGQRHYMSASVSNLYFRYPELLPRRIGYKDPTPLQKAMWEACVAIKQASQLEKKPYVLPKRFHVTMTVSALPNAAPPGEMVRAWLPVPRRYPFQEGFELTSASSPIQHLDDEESPIRAIYLEQPAKKNKPTTFKLDYNFTVHGVWFDLKPDAVPLIKPADPSVQPFTREAPHVVFSPEMRALSAQIVGSEPNPCRKAKALYDWIAKDIKYSYAIEYSTIRNISEYCHTHGYGDCGQEGLLFITLCRLNGIPARWQSGWNLFPGATTIHDWTEIYLEPYGWVPVDPYMGIYAMRYGITLSPDQRRELRDFYFGGLDQFRMAANSDHNQSLNPPKASMRSDTVDFQRGELEATSKNIYFDQFTYDLKWKEIKLAPGQ